MKKLQIVLFSLFLFHVSVSILVNINSFNFLKQNNRDKNLNEMGKLFINKLEKIDIPYFVRTYSNYSGTLRGYAYYSPNIRNVKNIYDFYDENNTKIDGLMKTYESNLKFNTMLVNLTDIISEKNIREEIAKSLFNNITCDSEIKELNIKLKVRRFKLLQDYQLGEKRDTIKVFEAYKIINND